jgi:hypothetical protein
MFAKLSNDFGHRRLVDILTFIVNGCSNILSLYWHLFVILVFLYRHFLLLGKKRQWLFLSLKAATGLPLLTTGMIKILSFSEVSEFLIHVHIFHYFKSKWNTSQHSYTKTKSTTKNLVTFLDTVMLPLYCQRKFVSIYSHRNRTFDLAFYYLLLDKISNYRLLTVYRLGFLVPNQ